MFTDTTAFTKVLLKATAKITIAGFLIGFLHQYDWVVAIILLAKIVGEVYKRVYKNKNFLFLTGILLTCIAGLIGEHWGVSNGYWKYHDVPRDLPLWLPFAWMLAFSFLYKLELRSIPLLKKQSLTNKIILTLIYVIVFPAFGEIITIKTGVWTYYWPYQIFGVPLYAILCLVFVHMMVNLVLVWANKKYQWKDVVFTINKN
ncbi:MAG: hypothetical protein HWD85_05390 [Flavobacteriaceae bacterium]|nr:hypothetical protein [Flavobacteriaceae bacterium]